MVLSTVDIKKNILLEILDFPNNVESYKANYQMNDNQTFEILTLNRRVADLIDSLQSKGSKYISPRLSSYEFEKLKRVLELTFYYRSDINAVAMDIGEKLSYSNKLLQIGMDYIFENLKQKPPQEPQAPKVPDPVASHEAINQSPQTQERINPNQGKKPAQRLSLMSIILFFVILVAGGIAIYNTMFNKSATRVTSLVQEYRSDQKLSKIAISSNVRDLNILGSASLVGVINSWKDKFILKYPELKLEAKKADSAIAISKLIDGEANIVAVSRIPNIKERKKSKKAGALIAEHKVAMDAVVVIVNRSNPVNELSVEDLKQIFLEKENPSWWLYGGMELDLERYSPSPESGTYDFFKERVMFTEEMSGKVIKMYDVAQLIDMVKSNPGAIGFCSLANVIGNEDVKVVPISTMLKNVGISPLKENGVIDANSIKRAEYPLTRYLYLLTAGNLTDTQAKFIDFFRSDESQGLLGQNGLVSIY